MNDNELLGGIPVTLKEMWFGSAKRNSDGNFSEIFSFARIRAAITHETAFLWDTGKITASRARVG